MNEVESVENQIIAFATDSFLTKGFKSVTMDDLATAMGMSKKTIYGHFKTKSDLVTASAEFLFETICEGIDRIQESNYNPIEELFIINEFVAANMKNEHTSPLYQLQKYYPKTHAMLLKKQFDIARECLIDNLKNGINQHLYRTEIDVEFISRLYFLSINGIKNQELFPQKEFPAHQLTISYLHYHIRAITTPKGLGILENLQKNTKL